MSQENVEIVRRANDAFNSGDWDTWAGFVHPEVVYYDRNYLDTPPVIKARAGRWWTAARCRARI